MKQKLTIGICMLFFLVLLSSFAYADLTDGAVVYYKFDENTSTLAGNSVSGLYNGTITNPLWVNGKINSGLEFNKVSNRYMTTPIMDLFGTGKSATYSFWIKPTSATDSSAIFSFRGDTLLRGSYDVANKRIAFQDNNGVITTNTNSVDHTTGNWYHITMVVDGTTLKSYVNGVLQTETKTIVYGASAGSVYWFGTWFNAGTFISNYPQDELALWNRALSSAEVEELYDLQVTGFESGQYPFTPPTPTDCSPYNITCAVFNQSFSVASQDLSPFGIAFNTDGTKMFILGNNGEDVNEYTLSTGFDVSTASFVDSFSVTSQDTAPSGIAFNTDGTKMFITGLAGQDVNEYTLSTGFDVSTASFVDSFSVASQETNPYSIAFNTDGTKMFILGDSGDDVNEYTLSTGFDVSTASFVDSFSVTSQETNPKGLTFNTDGTKMFIVGTSGDDVNEYTLSTGFDVSTASFVDSFSVASQDLAPYGIAFNTDGTKMFILGDSGDAVYEYHMFSSGAGDIKAYDTKNSDFLFNFTVTLPNGTTITTTNGTASYDWNLTYLHNFTVSALGFYTESYTNINMSDAFQSNLTQFTGIGARDIYTNVTIPLTLQNSLLQDKIFIGGGAFILVTDTLLTSSGIENSDINKLYVNKDNSYINILSITQTGYSGYNSGDLANTVFSKGESDFIADLTPLPLKEFNFVNLDNIFVNNTYQINWTESISPSGKAVTYNVLIYNQTNLVINTTTSDLFYTFNMATLPSNRFNVTIIARETGTPQTQSINSFLYLNKINELYFKELKSSSPLENATITIRFPTGTTTQYLTNSLGRIQFPSFEGTTLLIGSYNITFEDYAGFQSPVTFNPSYSSLPINQTYNITITNITVNLYDVETNTLINQYADIIFSNLFAKNTSNGTLFIEDATIVAGQYSVYVDSEGYQLTQKVFTYTSQDSVELSIYMLNESSPVAGNLFVTVYDSIFYKQLGADVRLQAYFPSVNDFIEVGQCFTDSNGECVFGIELGEKLYRVVATKEINGVTYTAQSSPTGVFYQVDNTQVELYLITSGIIELEDDIFLNVQSFNTELEGENLTIYSTFQGTDGLDYTVCQRLKVQEGFDYTTLYTTCNTGPSGTVGFNDTIFLNLSKSYIVEVYTIKNENIWKIYGTYYYLGAESFQSAFQTYITVIIAFSLAGLLAISRWLKNVNIFFMGLIGATFIYVTSVPSYISLAYGGVIVVFSVMNMYISRKRSDNESS